MTCDFCVFRVRYTSDKSKRLMGRNYKKCVRNHSSHLVILIYSILEISSLFPLSLSSIKYLAPEVEEEIKGKSFWVYFVGFIVFMAFQYGG